MEENRKNPDQILHDIQQNEQHSKMGQLKIFFGYAAGVGKTYAMLKAAKIAKQQGVDVVIGYVEPHARPETIALTEGLPNIPLRKTKYNAIDLKEFDLNSALSRKPQLILIDELAHTNANDSRNKKRFQDVRELLRAGINVYSTINVQHIESLNDMVASITGIMVRERIPDEVFDEATQVELVDIEPQELMQRFVDGKIYRETQARQALYHFFTIENLTALREIALRRCADRVSYGAESVKAQRNSEYYTEEHILVCISSSPTNPKIIRTAARMAQAFHARFTALFVETPNFQHISDENKKRLREHIRLSQQLGASVETVFGDDIALQIAEFARLSSVSKIVMGRYNAVRRKFFAKQTLTEKLISFAPQLDIYIIPDKPVIGYYLQKRPVQKRLLSISDFFYSCIILCSTTAIGFMFYHFGFSEANIITIYILGVLLTAVLTSTHFYSFISALVSVLVFNFFFTEPRFSLQAYDSGYPVTFFIMFLAAFMTGNLALRIKEQASQSAQAAYRTKVMFDTNQALQKASGKKEIISVTAKQLTRLLERSVIFYSKNDEGVMEQVLFFQQDTDVYQEYLTENELAVATWVYENNKRAGATTDTLSSAKCLYLAVRVAGHVHGVIGVTMEQGTLEPFENSILLSILGECGMALENERIAYEKEQAAILAKNEQLRANLLRAISHDLRTPLTSISGNAGVLLSQEDQIPFRKKRQLYTDIYDDSMWLINLVENLLAVTRIEGEGVNLRFQPELMEEVIEEALKHINRKSNEHQIVVKHSEELILVRMDARLIMQVIINIVDNAIKYTPIGSCITIHTFVSEKQLITEIYDNGPGIPNEEKPHIFDMFYTSGAKFVDSRRSLGMGLALCKSIINAHGGEIKVLDGKPTGTMFRFALSIKEVTLHE